MWNDKGSKALLREIFECFNAWRAYVCVCRGGEREDMIPLRLFLLLYHQSLSFFFFFFFFFIETHTHTL